MADNKKELTEEELEQTQGGTFIENLRTRPNEKGGFQTQVFKGNPYNKPKMKPLIVNGRFPSPKIESEEAERAEQTEAITELLEKKKEIFDL